MNNEVSSSIQGETPDCKHSSRDDSSVPYLLQHSDTSNMVYLNVEEACPALPTTYEDLKHDPNMSSVASYSPLNTVPDVSPQRKHCRANTVASTSGCRNLNYYGQYIDTATGQTLDVMSAPSPTHSPTAHMDHNAFQDQTEEVTVQESQLINNNGRLQIVLGNECYQIEGISNESESTVTYALSQEGGIIIAHPTTSIANQDHLIPTIVLESDSIVADASLLSSLRHCSMTQLSKPEEQQEEAQEDWAVSEDNNVSEDYPAYDEDEDQHTSTEENRQQEIVEIHKLRASRYGRTIQQPDHDGAFTIIPDVSVLCRARATLPVAHLSLSYVRAGVFVRHGLHSKTRFGPIQGVCKVVNEKSLKALVDKFVKDNKPLYLVRTNEGIIYNIDVSDETQANWMCYLRYSSTRPNIWLEQIGEELFVSSRAAIRTKWELLLGYSPRYLHTWPVLAEATITLDCQPSLEWLCYECPQQFASSSHLQKHLDSHDKVKKSAICPKLRKRKRNIVYKCNLCDKTFPRSFSLSRHLLTHETKEVIDEENEPIQKITESQMSQNDLRDVTENSKVLSKASEPVIQDSVNRETSASLQSHSVSPKSKEILFGNVAVNLITNVASNSVLGDHCSVLNGSQDEEDTNYSPKNCSKVESNGNIPDNYCDVTKIDCNMTKNDCKTSETETKTQNRPAPERGFEILMNNNNILEEAEKCEVLNEERGGVRTGTVCVICCEAVANKAQVRQHAEQHRSTSGLFVCIHCAKSFPEYTMLRKHVRSCHTERRFPCPKCGASFRLHNKMLLHMLSHSETRQFLCNDCGKQFKRKDKLKDHIKLQHLRLPEPQVAKTVTAELPTARTPTTRSRDCSGFTFVCRQCHVGFKRRGMLVNHIARRHPTCSAGDVPELGLPILRTTMHYYCTYCDKVYRSNAKRKQHILNNHPGEVIPSGSSVSGGGGGGSQVGCVAVWAQHCPAPGCFKQYASKAKLLQHQRRKHPQYKNQTPSRSNKLAKSSTKPPAIDLSAANFVISRNTEPHVLVTEEQLCQSSQHEKTSHVSSVVPFSQQELHHNITTDSTPIQNEIHVSTYQIHLTENHPTPTPIDLLDDDLLVKQSYVDEAVRCLNYMKSTSNADFAERQQSWKESLIQESIPKQNPKLDLSEMTWLKLNADKFDRNDRFQKFQLSGHIVGLDTDQLPPMGSNSDSSANQYTDR